MKINDRGGRGVDKYFEGAKFGGTPNPSNVERQNYHYLGEIMGVFSLSSIELRYKSSSRERLIPPWIG